MRNEALSAQAENSLLLRARARRRRLGARPCGYATADLLRGGRI